MSVAESADRSPYHGYRFPPEIIAHAVWLYFRFHLSFRDVQDLLAERGIIVSHEAISFSTQQELCSIGATMSTLDGNHVRRKPGGRRRSSAWGGASVAAPHVGPSPDR